MCAELILFRTGNSGGVLLNTITNSEFYNMQEICKLG